MQDDVFCPGNGDVYSFLKDVLDEVMALFPGEFIHIGGDECPKRRWKSCPKCQKKIIEEGLADEFELQSFFVRQMEQYLNNNGRRLIGWDEILEGGLAPNAAVMSWRGIEGGVLASQSGHDVVMTPNTHCYFDYYQSGDHDNEPAAIGGFVPLERVYSFNPLTDIPSGKTHHILGGQGNLWTEFIQTGKQVEYMAYPRACALAEVLWSGLGDDYSEFIKRLAAHLKRLDLLEIQYRPLDRT
jgi:hexosaminidase